MKRRATGEILVASFFLVVVLFICLPMPGSPSDRILGGDFVYPTLWTFHFAAKSLLEQGELPTSTQDLNFPAGGKLTIIGWTYFLFVLGGKLFGAGILTSVNLAILFFLWMGCYFGYRLAFRLTGRRLESIVGGLAFGICPYVLSLAWNGQIEKLSHGFVPLIALLILKIAESRRMAYVFLFSLVFALLLATSPYNAILAALLAVLLGARLLIGETKLTVLTRLLRFSLAAFLAFLAVLPFLAYWHLSKNQPDLEPLFLPSPSPHLPHQPVDSFQLNNASLAGWFAPSFGLTKGPVGSPVLVVHVHYLGFVVMALATLLIFLRRKDRTPGEFNGPGFQDRVTVSPLFLLVVAGFFFLLASGYYLAIGEGRYTIFGRYLQLPLYWLYQLWPEIGSFAVPYRGVLVVSLCLAMLAAIGLTRLTARLGSGQRILVVAMAAGALLFEFLVVSPAPFPLPVRELDVPKVYNDLNGMEDCGAVLDVPNEAHNLPPGTNGPFIYYQSAHKHPVTIQLNYGPLHLVPRSRFYDALSQAITGSPPDSDPVEDDSHLVDFRYLVLHTRMLERESQQRVISFLEENLDRVRAYPNDGIVLYSPRSGTEQSESGAPGETFLLKPDLPRPCP